MSLAKKLYDLQLVDLEIRKQKETLDDIVCRLSGNEALLSAKAELIAGETHLAGLEKQQRDEEWEIDDLQNKIARLSDKMYGGKVTNSKELLSLEQESGMFKNKKGQKEEKLLGLMTEVEATKVKINLDKERVRSLEKEWQQEQAVLTQRQTEVNDRLLELDKIRQLLISEIGSQTIEIYEWTKTRKGQAIARVEQGTCQGCRINLPMNELQQARTGKLVLCSSCGRILYLG